MTAGETSTIGEWAGSHSPIVVAVDGSDGSRTALAWATAEAERVGAELRIVTVADEAALTPRFPVRLTPRRATEMLADTASAATSSLPDNRVTTELLEGDAAAVLVEHLDDARMLVVGKRGLGAIPRMLVGSTSLAVAGRSPIPVAVVPTGWDPAAHRHEPVVVGVDPYKPHAHLVKLAFRRAQELGVPLVPVHGWEAPSGLVWSEAPVDQWEREAHDEFSKVLVPWRNRFPEVDVRPVSASKHPAIAVLDVAEAGAQLVLLGRHETSRFTGFVFGSVTRAVLHYATVPVLVVPTGDE